MGSARLVLVQAGEEKSISVRNIRWVQQTSLLAGITRGIANLNQIV